MFVVVARCVNAPRSIESVDIVELPSLADFEGYAFAMGYTDKHDYTEYNSGIEYRSPDRRSGIAYIVAIGGYVDVSVAAAVVDAVHLAGCASRN